MKPVTVKFFGEGAEEWDRINKIVGEEQAKGIANSESQQLLKSIKQKIELIKFNPQYEKQIFVCRNFWIRL